MKVLLDENLDHALRKLLGRHDVVTAAYMGWAWLKNGELLRAADHGGIEILETAISAIQLPIIKSTLSAIIAVIDHASPGSFRVVECGTFSRKKPAG